MKQDTVIVFDWDDTVLPTSWLQWIHAVTGGGPLRPEVQQQVVDLCTIATATLDLAATMGTVVIITNSAPGWVDQSCQMFMPQLLQQVRGYPIFARPMHGPPTFKIGAFRKECRNYRNIVSVGDGDSERIASLKLQATPEPRSAMSMLDGGDDRPRIIKSVKLVDLPTCQQLIAQHEMLQNRLTDITAYHGNLDLKARFPGNAGNVSNSPNKIGKVAVGNCSLVHFARPSPAISQAAGLPMAGATVGSAGFQTNPVPEGGGKAAQGLGPLRPLQPTAMVRSNSASSQLPPLGRDHGRPWHSDGELHPGKPGDRSTLSTMDRLAAGGGADALRAPEEDNSIRGPAALAAALATRPMAAGSAEGGGGDGSAIARDWGEGSPGSPPLTAGGSRAAATPGQSPPPSAGSPATRATSPGKSGSLWRVRVGGSPGSSGGGSGGQSLYPGLGKKRPVLVAGAPPRSAGAAWRENSAPAATRGF